MAATRNHLSSQPPGWSARDFQSLSTARARQGKHAYACLKGGSNQDVRMYVSVRWTSCKVPLPLDATLTRRVSIDLTGTKAQIIQHRSYNTISSWWHKLPLMHTRTICYVMQVVVGGVRQFMLWSVDTWCTWGCWQRPWLFVTHHQLMMNFATHSSSPITASSDGTNRFCDWCARFQCGPQMCITIMHAQLTLATHMGLLTIFWKDTFCLCRGPPFKYLFC
jgi:hypothetical protein